MMKKTLILLFLLLSPALVSAHQLTKNDIVGIWKLNSKYRYLSLAINRKGFVAITEGKKGKKQTKPQALPLGIWSLTDGVLKITINGKTKFIYRHIKIKGNKITARNRHGKIVHFSHSPLIQ